MRVMQKGQYRVLVTSSRDLANRALVCDLLDDILTVAMLEGSELVVVHGHCGGGGDQFADDWGHAKQAAGFPVRVERHPAKGHPTQDFGEWPGAGPRRNRYMVSLDARECLAFIGPCTSARCRRPEPHGSHGASGCADEAEKAGIRTDRWELWKTS